MKPFTKKRWVVFACAVAAMWGAYAGGGSEVARLDQQDIFELKTAVIEAINEDRRRHGLQPVQFDSLASVVGDRHCREALRHDFHGHFGLDGSKPYHRYALLGGYDAISQNAAAAMWAGYKVDAAFLRERLLKLHRNMYNEKPPMDGHRRNILDPAHNYCGIGLAFSARGVRITQEFIDRYVTLHDLPAQELTLRTALEESLWVRGETLHGETVKSVTIYYEPHPQPMTVRALNRTYSYGLPRERRDYFKKVRPPYRYSDGTRGHVELWAGDTGFAFPVIFWKKQPGIYTVVIWVHSRDLGETISATNLCFFVR